MHQCTVKYRAPVYSTVQCTSAQYSTVQCTSALYSTVHKCTVLYSTVHAAMFNTDPCPQRLLQQWRVSACTVHCPLLYTVHCKLYKCILYSTVQYSTVQCTVQSGLPTVGPTLGARTSPGSGSTVTAQDPAGAQCTVQCALCTVHCALCTVNYVLCSVN